MIKKLLLRIKPLIIKILEKIESIEKISPKKQRLKIIKHKFSIPDWVLISLFFVVFTSTFILTQPSDIYESLYIFTLKILSIFVISYCVWLSVRYYIKKIKSSSDTEEYKSNLILFWSLILLYITVTVFIKISDQFTIYVLPTQGFSLLITLLTNSYWGGMFALLSSIIATEIFGWKFEHFIYLVLSSLTIIFWSDRIYSRKDILAVVIKSIFINIFIAVSSLLIIRHRIDFLFDFKTFTFYYNEILISKVLLDIILSSIFSWICVTILLSPFEIIYHKTTNIKLVELSNFNHPLLKRLITETPGTYHHSIIVSSLAEQAAVELRANSLLCKVAGYYHDIGKLTKPEYFIENQIAIPNPHREINPTLSALIIINHVKEGVKLAEEYKLDKAIIDIIQQHHGNSLIYGLHSKTLELPIETLEDTLRYPGPKPQTKESAIMMIADSCEAACRGISEPDPQKIKDIVESVINSKFVEGQFDESPLTLRDLYKIANIITQLLISFYHLRTSQVSLSEKG